MCQGAAKKAKVHLYLVLVVQELFLVDKEKYAFLCMVSVINGVVWRDSGSHVVNI
jgi:hypothetical protein